MSAHAAAAAAAAAEWEQVRKYLAGQVDKQVGDQAATATDWVRIGCGCACVRWTNSRLVLGRLEMVDKLQANGRCRLPSLVFLEDGGWSVLMVARKVQAFAFSTVAVSSSGGPANIDMMTVLGEVQKRRCKSTPRRSFSSCTLLHLFSRTHQSSLLTLASAVLDFGRRAIGCFALAVAVHDFGLPVVA